MQRRISGTTQNKKIKAKDVNETRIDMIPSPDRPGLALA